MAEKQIIFKHPSGPIVKVKLGFSWGAFFFGPLWALAKAMWIHFFILLVVLLFLNVFADYAEARDSLSLDLIVLISLVAYMYLCGRYGNFWFKSSLLESGYLPVTNEESHFPS